MRFARLLVLLLSFRRPAIASAQLVPRGDSLWPDFDFGDGATFFRGIGNLFSDPQDSDTSNTIPPPDTTSDKQAPPDSREASPASPPSSDASSAAEPVYHLEINNDPTPIPDHTLDTPAFLPSLNEECDPTDVSSQAVDSASCAFVIGQLINMVLIAS